MSSQDDDAWLAALAGRPADDTSPMTREAAAVRAYFQQRRAAEQATPPDPAREIRMMNYLRAQGAFNTAPRPRNLFARLTIWLANLVHSHRQSWPRWAAGAVVVAAVLALPLANLPNRQQKNISDDPGDPSPTYRGNVAQSVLVQADPDGAARAIVTILDHQRIRSRTLEEGESRIIEAKVAADQHAAASKALVPWAVNIPENGILIIRINKLRP